MWGTKWAYRRVIHYLVRCLLSAYIVPFLALQLYPAFLSYKECIPYLYCISFGEVDSNLMNLPRNSLLLQFIHVCSSFPGSLILIISLCFSHEQCSPKISDYSPFWVHRAIFCLSLGWMGLTWTGQCIWPFFGSTRFSSAAFTIWHRNQQILGGWMLLLPKSSSN